MEFVYILNLLVSISLVFLFFDFVFCLPFIAGRAGAQNDFISQNWRGALPDCDRRSLILIRPPFPQYLTASGLLEINRREGEGQNYNGFNSIGIIQLYGYIVQIIIHPLGWHVREFSKRQYFMRPHTPTALGGKRTQYDSKVALKSQPGSNCPCTAFPEPPTLPNPSADREPQHAWHHGGVS